MISLNLTRVRNLAAAAAIGAVGGVVFTLAGLPAGWLSGAMVFVAAATLAGVPTGIPNVLRDGLFVLLGLTMGAGVQPEMLQKAAEWPVSLGMLALTVIGITAASFMALRHFGGWQKETAFYGAIPGALSFVLSLASERGADIARIATTQTIRLLILVAVLPMFIAGNAEIAGGGAFETPVSSLGDLTIGLSLSGLAGYLMNRIGIPAGWMVGGFLVSLTGNLSGLMPMGIPEAVQIPCFVLLGAMIGSRFEAITFCDLLTLAKVSVAAFIAGVTVAAAGASLTAYWLNIPFGQALLAFAPGGLEVMTLLAYLLDLDPIYVAVHQIVRFVSMMLLLPCVTILVLGRARSRPIP